MKGKNIVNTQIKPEREKRPVFRLPELHTCIYSIFTIVLCALWVQAQQTSDTVSVIRESQKRTGLSPITNIDSLKAEARRLRAAAQELERAAYGLETKHNCPQYVIEEMRDDIDDLEDEIDDLEDEIDDAREDIYDHLNEGYYPEYRRGENEEVSAVRETMRGIRDTVMVLTRNTAKELVDNIKHSGRPSARERGFGGGLSFTMGINAIDMGPVYEMQSKFETLKEIGFDIPNEHVPVTLIGGLGYGGVGEGLRLGGGGWGGHKSYYQEKTVNDTVDSLYHLRVGIGMGGFLIEKVLVRGDLNLNLGGFIGAGSLDIQLDRGEGESSIFFDTQDDFDTPRDINTLSQLQSTFLFLELHGGFTYTLRPWFHVGTDVSAPFFISSNGFKNSLGESRTGSYVTINPGLRIRIVLGNLG